MKNFLSKSLSILLLIGLPITFVECGNFDNSDNSNVEISDAAYQESSIVNPIINIHAIANKTVDEVKEILGNANSSEMTKYGIKNTYSDGKIEILFFKDVAFRISVDSNDGNPELLGFNKNSIKNLSDENKIKIGSYITYKNLEGIYLIDYNGSEGNFMVLTNEEYLSDFLQYNSSTLNNDDNINDEKDFAAQYYSKLDNIISKYNKNYSDSYYNELDSLLNEIYTLLKQNTDKNVFSKIESQEIEWIKYKESKNNLKDRIKDTEMRIRDLLHIMENLQVYDVMNEYTPYFKSENNNSIKSSANNSVKSEIMLSEIPDVLGLDVETAKNILDNSHLKCSIEVLITETESDDGKVISQSIEAKSLVAEWSTLTIRVGNYVEY